MKKYLISKDESTKMKKSMFITTRVLDDGGALLFCPDNEHGIMCHLEPKEFELWEANRFEELLKYPNTNLLLEGRFLVPENENQIEFQRQLREKEALRKESECISFTITPTLFCNARCEYCFQKGVTQNRMNEKTMKSVINFIKSISLRYGAKKVNIRWFGGEPLLEQQVIKYVSFELINHFGRENYTASITTNGSLITDDVLDLFYCCNIFDVQITLDGLKNRYNQIKNYYNNKNNFSSVCKNIEKCLKREIFVCIRLNISKTNYDEILMLIEYLDERFKCYKESGLFTISPSTISGSKEDCSLLSYQSEEMRWILSNVYEKLYKLEYDVFELGQIGTICDAYRYHSYFIDPDGEIYRCDRLIGKKQHSIGNVYEGIKISNAELLSCLTQKLPEKCNSCKILPMCQGGCKALENTNLERCRDELSIIDKIIDIVYNNSKCK